MKRNFAFFGDVAQEIGALGTDDAVMILSLLASVAKQPEVFDGRSSVRIVEMKEAGEHCVRVELGHDPSDFLQGWTAVVAIKGDDLVCLFVHRGLDTPPSIIGEVQNRYRALDRELFRLNQQTEPWPPQKR
ncbi:hypothetical protein [Azospirillum griseum]|uniref:hypothetical protein n=1 Tax=Azospirillum griseum TaxID=2496639 RepID=UPI00131515CE|nr:hypothetical protein [Azospirillum griseum]